MTRSSAATKKKDKTTVGGVATIVKTLRHRVGLTLNELARDAGIAPSTISKIESGQLSPGYDIITKLATGLRVEVADLFKSAIATAPTGRRGVTRRGQGERYETERYHYEVLAGDVARKEFLPLVAVVKARERLDWDSLPAHDGEELVYVLEGQITLFSEHYEPLILNVGDSVYFDSRSGHALISSSESDARIFWVNSQHVPLTRSSPDANVI